MVLDKYDIAALKLIKGMEQDVFTSWGAALGLTVEKLKNMGLVIRVYQDSTIFYELTEEGEKVLKDEV